MERHIAGMAVRRARTRRGVGRMSMARRILLASMGLGVLSLAQVATAAAKPAASESITSVIPMTAFPSGPPNKATYTGSYTSMGAFGDAGTVSVQALFASGPSPRVAVLQTLRTLTSDEGNGTLMLRCTEHATAADLSLYPNVPGSGRCAILNATGAYAALHGSGTIAGTLAWDPSGTSATLTDAVALGG